MNWEHILNIVLTHLVGGRAAINEESVPLHELPECVADGVARSPDPYSLHHARVPQLAAAQLTVKQLTDHIVTIKTQHNILQLFIYFASHSGHLNFLTHLIMNNGIFLTAL